jgi:membrane-bound lytic murein transglycosylase MltF
MNTILTVALAASVTGLNQDIGSRTGDFDAMLEARTVRVLVPYSRTLYFNDRGKQRGLTADTLRDFETFLNKKFYVKNRPITVVALPSTRDRLLSGLAEGRGDIAAGNITITAARDKLVDFSQPLAEGVVEIVVTGPASPKLASLDDLGGQEVHVRSSSSYQASLVALNARLRAERKPEARIVSVPDTLEDEDLMDMVAAGLLKLIVVDSWKAKLWAGMLKGRIKARTDLALTSPQSIGWAFRSNSPKLAAVINEFLDLYPGSRARRFRDYPRYLAELRNATADADWKRFEHAVTLFRKYAPRYGFDYLMVAAQGYQESGLDQNARSHKGAIGVMQIMPDTGATLNVGDITQEEANIHGGIKYLRRVQREMSEEGVDENNRILFAFAGYNAGPTRVQRLRDEAEKLGLDPNVWFNNVEVVAARRIGQETVLYVRNIYKYYVTYKLQLEMLEARRIADTAYKPPKPPPKKKSAKAARPATSPSPSPSPAATR